MHPSRVLFAVSAYLAAFAAAAPLAGNAAGGLITDLDKRESDAQEVSQPFTDLLAGIGIGPRDVGTAISFPFGQLEEIDGEDAEGDDDSLTGFAKRSSKVAKKKAPKAPKKKTPKTTKKKSPKTPSTHKSPKTSKTPKTNKTPTTPKTPKAPKTTKTPKSAPACKKGRKRNACESETEEYKFVKKVAKKQTLQVGKSYAMITKSKGLISHHRLVIAKVVRNSAGQLAIEAKMTQLLKDGDGGSSGSSSGDTTGQEPKDQWICKGDKENYKMKGEVAANWENFSDVKAAGEQLIIDGGKYNIITNNCQTFAKNLAKQITG